MKSQTCVIVTSGQEAKLFAGLVTRPRTPIMHRAIRSLGAALAVGLTMDAPTDDMTAAVKNLRLVVSFIDLSPPESCDRAPLSIHARDGHFAAEAKLIGIRQCFGKRGSPQLAPVDVAGR